MLLKLAERFYEGGLQMVISETVIWWVLAVFFIHRLVVPRGRELASFWGAGNALELVRMAAQLKD